jgi:hypothetical protein
VNKSNEQIEKLLGTHIKLILAPSDILNPSKPGIQSSGQALTESAASSSPDVVIQSLNAAFPV